MRFTHPPNSLDRWLAVIQVFGDLSGTPREKLLVAAAYIGTEKSWVTADVKWAATLKAANVSEFHATDFFAHPPQGAFRGWTLGSKRHRRLEYLLSSIAKAKGMIGFAFAMETSGFASLKTELDKVKAKERIKSMRLICVQGCLEAIAKFVDKNPLPPGEGIVAIWESEKGIGEVSAFFKYAKKRRATWTRPYIDVTNAGKAVRPLQMADLFAYTVRYELEHLGEQVPKWVKRVVGKGNADVKFMSEADAIRSLPNIAAFFAANPDGLVRPPGFRKS